MDHQLEIRIISDPVPPPTPIPSPPPPPPPPLHIGRDVSVALQTGSGRTLPLLSAAAPTSGTSSLPCHSPRPGVLRLAAMDARSPGQVRSQGRQRGRQEDGLPPPVDTAASNASRRQVQDLDAFRQDEA
ncbi:hypothetical protein BRADI_2g36542v3 [Brachypodium distachyon]|uniref:Uncharacterized protein n=1 Tax=Brachypodium distachyon TaxID=15368 RepID=A0A2K2DC60_BRADI|nr:hypothetical protein BRADI_2g36542v3 [Brachypodium distachyon]